MNDTQRRQDRWAENWADFNSSTFDITISITRTNAVHLAMNVPTDPDEREDEVLHFAKRHHEAGHLSAQRYAEYCEVLISICRIRSELRMYQEGRVPGPEATLGVAAEANRIVKFLSRRREGYKAKLRDITARIRYLQSMPQIYEFEVQDIEDWRRRASPRIEALPGAVRLHELLFEEFYDRVYFIFLRYFPSDRLYALLDCLADVNFRLAELYNTSHALADKFTRFDAIHEDIKQTVRRFRAERAVAVAQGSTAPHGFPAIDEEAVEFELPLTEVGEEVSQPHSTHAAEDGVESATAALHELVMTQENPVHEGNAVPATADGSSSATEEQPTNHNPKGSSTLAPPDYTTQMAATAGPPQLGSVFRGSGRSGRSTPRIFNGSLSELGEGFRNNGASNSSTPAGSTVNLAGMGPQVRDFATAPADSRRVSPPSSPPPLSHRRVNAASDPTMDRGRGRRESDGFRPGPARSGNIYRTGLRIWVGHPPRTVASTSTSCNTIQQRRSRARERTL